MHEIESTPGPKYSTMAPVPPCTVSTPATLRITSFDDVHPFIFPVNFTPITYSTKIAFVAMYGEICKLECPFMSTANPPEPKKNGKFLNLVQLGKHK